MQKIILFIFIFSLGSTLGMGIVLGKCIEIYTGSLGYRFVFQLGFSFLSSLFVSHFIVKNYIKVLWGLK